MRVQACLSPVWDTGLALLALLESGMDPADAGVQQAAAWLLREEDPRPRRLVGAGPGRRAERVGVRVRQRSLPGRRRHGAVVLLALHKARALDKDDARARAALGDRDAEPQRRLGRVRQGQHLAASRPPALRGLRRDDRSAERRRHRARGRDARRARAGPHVRPGGEEGAALPLRPAGKGGFLVRALGRQSRLRRRRRPPCPRRGGRADGQLRGPARGALADRAAEPRRRLGRDLRFVRRGRSCAGGARARRRRPHGRCSAWSRRGAPIPTPRGAARSI